MPGEEDGLCSPVLIGAVRSFDSMVLKTLTPIKTRGRGSHEESGGAAAAAEPSPPAAYVETLVSPFNDNLKPKGPVGGRPVVYHSRGSSGMAPGAYNPYDLTAAALSSSGEAPQLVALCCSLFPTHPSRARSENAAWRRGRLCWLVIVDECLAAICPPPPSPP
jgi:hypothetical protein